MHSHGTSFKKIVRIIRDTGPLKLFSSYRIALVQGFSAPPFALTAQTVSVKGMFGGKSDDQLMEEVKRGSQEAFSLLLKRHGGAVFGMVMRLFSGNRAQAEDVVQEVWVRVLEKADLYKGQGHCRAWLMTIARNEALGVFRRNVRFVDAEEKIEEAAAEFDVERHMGEGAAREKVRSLIDSLPPPQRAALVLWLEGDLSYEQIAAELQVTLGNAKTLIFRAKAALKAGMEEK